MPKQNKSLKIMGWLITVFVSILILQVGYFVINGMPQWHSKNDNFIPMKAVVTEVLGREETSYSYDDTNGMKELSITFTAKLTDDYRAGEIVTATQAIDGYMPEGSQREVQTGDKILLLEGYDPYSAYDYIFSDYLRSDIIMFLLFAFFAALLIFGKMKGLNTIISLTLTCASIFLVFIPSILANQNPYLWSILTCLYIIISTLLIVNGYDRKTLVAIIGCFGGVVLAGVMTYVFSILLKTTGVVDEQSLYLYNLGAKIDLKSIVFAAIIIGAVGAIMDVAMSIAASLHELCLQVEKPSFALLLKSGFTIGKDMMGTMANTLILAYIGGSLTTVVLIYAYNNNVIQVINREMIVTEILQGLIGSFAILLTIPLTSLLAALVFPSIKNPLVVESEDLDIPRTTLENAAQSEPEPVAPETDKNLLKLDNILSKNKTEKDIAPE